MKKILTACTMLMLCGVVSAQAWTGNGDQKLQVGFNGWGYGSGITASYDYGISKIFSIGAGANLYFSGYKTVNGKDQNSFIFGRLNAHLQGPLNIPKQWDIYPGIDLGVLGGGFGIGAHLGVRYFFNDSFGVYGEFGNNGSLGISFNF